MPVPDTTDVGKLIRFFRKEKPSWSDERVKAAALNTARRNGADIGPPRRNKGRQRATG